MSTASGIDLNGVCDCAVLLDRPPRPAPVPPVVVVDTPLGVLTGREAVEAPCGRPGWATGGTRRPVLALLRALARDERPASDPALRLGEHLGSLLPGKARSAVVAVPDTHDFDERTRARLLDGALRAGLELSLLWRPVAALLGWGESLSADELSALHGCSACVVQLLPDGIALGGLGLECAQQSARPSLVPVRRRDGVREFRRWPGGELTALLARDSGTDADSLWNGPWAWNVLLGRAASLDLRADAQARGGWRLLQGLNALGGALAGSLLAGVRTLLESEGPQLRAAGVILIEGPLADATLVTGAGPVSTLGQYVAGQLGAALGRAGTTRVIVARTAEALVARGCALSAARRAAREITYYDFLPMLEINVLRTGEHAFAELIGRTERVVGGSRYANTLADRFVVAKDTRSLVFYLLKEDEAGARRSETVLPVPPSADVEISLHVTQTPAQGYAQVEIRPARPGALGAAPILLDWAAMTAIEGSRAEILRELEFQGLGHPDIAPQRAHPLLWAYRRNDGLTIIKAMEQFVARPLKTTPRNQYDALARQTRTVVGLRSTLFFLTKAFPNQGTDTDRSAYTAFDSDGRVPDELASMLPSHVEAFRERLDADFAAVASARTRQDATTRRHLARLGSTLYAACPTEIVRYYRRIAARSVSDRTLVLHAGKILSADADLDSLFRYCAHRYDESVRDKKKLSMHAVRAAGDALAYRETAGAVLDTRSADKLAEAALQVLQEEITAHNFMVRFRAAARLALFLLRHRLRRRDFLHPSSSDPANRRRAERLDTLLGQAIDSNRLNEELKRTLEEIRAQIRYRGTNAIIDIDADDGDEPEDEDG